MHYNEGAKGVQDAAVVGLHQLPPQPRRALLSSVNVYRKCRTDSRQQLPAPCAHAPQLLIMPEASTGFSEPRIQQLSHAAAHERQAALPLARILWLMRRVLFELA